MQIKVDEVSKAGSDTLGRATLAVLHASFGRERGGALGAPHWLSMAKSEAGGVTIFETKYSTARLPGHTLLGISLTNNHC